MNPSPIRTPTLKLLTVNVNGLRGERASRLLCYQQQAAGNPDVTFLQEAKIGSSDDFKAALQRGYGPGAPWRGKWSYSPGDNHSRGTAILVRPGMALAGCAMHRATTDSDGRVVCWDWDVLHMRLRLLSVYAPTTPRDRPAFFTALQQYLATDRQVIMGGDLNCILRPEDESQPSAHRRCGHSTLLAAMATADLVDPWPAAGADKGFTYPASANRPLHARLDRWLIHRELASFVTAVRVAPGAPGDHHGVLLEIALPGLPPLGRRGWAFPTYMLYHPTLLPRLRAAVDAEVQAVQQQDPDADARDVWECVKARIRVVADRVHRLHAQEQSAELKSAQHVAEAALAAQYQAAPGAPSGLETAQACQHLRACVGKAAQRRSTALDAAFIQHGDRGTGWFHQLGREARPREPITHLRVPDQPDPVPLNCADAVATITAAAHAMYSSDSPTGLFRVGETDPAAQDRLLQHLARRLPTALRDTVDAADVHGELQLEDLTAALAACANGKAPGSDGLPYEVYRVFWDLLGPLLLAAANAAFTHGSVENGAAAAASLPRSWREGIIALIYKGRNLPRPELPSYRPITLLQCDYKIVCKAISNRLQPALDFIINALQTAFISGRDIRDNILYHLALAEWVEHSQQPAALLMLDIEKAYDRVHRPWLYRVVEAAGFGAHMQRWIRLLTSDGSSRVIINGHLSAPFPVRNGLEQGSTLSPVLWVLQLEPLTAYLQHLTTSGQLRTPLLPNGLPAPPASHHADDTVLTVRDVDVDGPVAKAAVQLFCRASNAKENASKGKGLTMGTHPPVVGTNAATGAKFPSPGDEPPRHLGIPLTTNMTTAANLCYTSRIQRLQHIGRGWQRHGLSFVGRVHVAKQVLGNALAYHLSFVPPTPPQLAALRKCIDGFTAWSLLPEDASLVCHNRALLKPTPVVACQDRAMGGVCHLDLDSFLAALHAKPLAQIAQPGQQPWKQLLRALLKEWAPPGTKGWGWVYGNAVPRADMPGFLSGLVASYRSTSPSRLPYPEGTDPRALLHEPLFHNNALRDPASAQPFLPPDPASLPLGTLAPLTLADLQEAPPAVKQHPTLQAVVDAFPVDWTRLAPQGALAEGLPGAPAWRISPDGQWAQDPEGIPWVVLVSGRLVAPDPDNLGPPVDEAWLPACVLPARKARRHWTLAERQAYDSAPPAERPAFWPLENQMLGPWADIQCYPLTHGHGSLPLIHYTVCEVRSRLTAARLVSEMQLPPDQPLAPAAWRPDPDRPSRLQQCEDAWKAQWEARQPPTNSQWFRMNPVAQPSWLQPRRSPPSQLSQLSAGGDAIGAGPSTSAASARGAVSPRQTRRQLQSARSPHSSSQEQAAALALGAGPAPPGPLNPVAPPPNHGKQQRQLWKRLWDCPASNRAKTLVWRLQHASLPCGLYLAAKGFQLPPSCPAPTCQEPAPSQQQPPGATLTHLFVECPLYAAARTWLADLWTAVTGAAAPPLDSPELLLGDRPAAWAGYPSGSGLQSLWTALRATWLWAVWCHHRGGEPSPDPSAAVVAAVVMELRRLMWAHFRMAALPDDTLEGLPRSHITAQLKPAQLSSFEASWAHEGVLCEVVRGDDHVPHLRVHLSLTRPVVAPGAAALPASQQGISQLGSVTGSLHSQHQPG